MLRSPEALRHLPEKRLMAFGSCKHGRGRRLQDFLMSFLLSSWVTSHLFAFGRGKKQIMGTQPPRIRLFILTISKPKTIASFAKTNPKDWVMARMANIAVAAETLNVYGIICFGN
jgi:hypothetical protein